MSRESLIRAGKPTDTTISTLGRCDQRKNGDSAVEKNKKQEGSCSGAHAPF